MPLTRMSADGRKAILDSRQQGKAEAKKKPDPSVDLRKFVAGRQFATVLADPPWQFVNRTGKMAPEHRRLSRYRTMTVPEICALPIAECVQTTAHLYLWVPNALLPEGLAVMQAWGFQYKSNIVWHKIRKDGGSDGRGVGFYFRNVTELVLFGVRGKSARTLAPGRTQVNYIGTRKREHSRKPDEQYPILRRAAPDPTWNFLLVDRGPTGPFGGTKRMRATHQNPIHRLQ